MKNGEEQELMRVVRANRHAAEALMRVLTARVTREIDFLVRAPIESVPVHQARIVIYQDLLGELKEKGDSL